MTTPPAPDSPDPWIAVIPIDREPASWHATVASFAEACDRVLVVSDPRMVARAEDEFRPHPNVTVTPGTVRDQLESLCYESEACVVVREPAVVTPDAFVRARQIVADDIRIATVSFFSNDGDYLTLPERNDPQLLLPPGQTESTVTRSLRAESLLDQPVPIPVPAGPAVVLTSTALRSLGTLLPASHAPNLEYALVEFALRATIRCLRNVLDPSTLVLRVPGLVPRGSALRDSVHRENLHGPYSFFPEFYDDAASSGQSAVAGAVSVARSTMRGLSILIDGTAIGPFEMGTQVQILNLIQSLARHDKVRKVLVGMTGHVPAYAEPYLDAAKITIVPSASTDFHVTERVDVLHRPCQTDGFIPWDHWRSISDRIVVTVQDLIAFNNPDYYPDVAAWKRYRRDLVHSMQAADGVVVVSEDVAHNIALEKLPVSPDRVRVIWNGVDHGLGHLNAGTPSAALISHGFVASEFVFLLGTSYSHKNRDLAIKAWAEMRARGLPVRMVMAGVMVPYGSTRSLEARVEAVFPEDLRQDLVILPDVTAEERIWLLNHASMVLYPTSAEGFGLVPFEAAQCDTPTLFVSFGPLAELIPDVPVSAADWSPKALADAAESLLTDPVVARAQVEAVRNAASKYTWDSTADQAVRFYRELVARPATGRIAFT